MTVKSNTFDGLPYGITSEDIHYWWNISGTQFLCSNQGDKGRPKLTLWSFDSTDEAINYLYANGFKQSAREINAHCKESGL